MTPTHILQRIKDGNRYIEMEAITRDARYGRKVNADEEKEYCK